MFKRAKGTDKSQLLSLYGEWRSYNRLSYVSVLTKLLFAMTLVLLPFDLLFFGAENAYTPFRLFTLVLLGAGYLALGRLPKSSDENTPSARWKTFSSLLLVMPALVYVVPYVYFLLKAPAEHHNIVLIANLMVIFFASFLLHRFWVEQYIVNIAGLMATLALFLFAPSLRNDALFLALGHISSMAFMFNFRREFAWSMLERYKSLTQLVPIKLARFITVANGKQELLEKLFFPRQRFTVCLSADWRNYQHLAKQYPADTIAKLFETFYDIVYDELASAAPSGCFYAEWVADELFVVFYSDNDDHEAMMAEALEFVGRFATTTAEKVRTACNIDLVYDIGLASGEGLLGLQGPKARKKTTITAEVAGTAARLQAEAKALRKHRAPNSSPIVIMDDRLHQLASRSGLLTSQPFESIQAQTKDISGEKFFLWQAPPTAQNVVRLAPPNATTEPAAPSDAASGDRRLKDLKSVS